MPRSLLSKSLFDIKVNGTLVPRWKVKTQLMNHQVSFKLLDSYLGCLLPYVTERKKYDFYGSLKSAKIGAAQQLHVACMHFCSFACPHPVARLWHKFWQTRRNQKSASRIFLRFMPSACRRSLLNLDHLEELGLAILGKDVFFTVSKLEH